MTESDLNRDPPRAPAEGKRPWSTPQIIVSESARMTEAATPTSFGGPDRHSGGTVQFS
jgi:hypothetical protein